MDWGRGFSARYYASFVDPDSWGDGDRFDILDGSVSNELTGLRTSAQIKCRNYRETRERLIRVWLDTRQDDSGSHTPLFTGYTSSPEKTYTSTSVSSELQCYSVLKPAEDILLTQGWYAPYNADGVNIIRSLLKCTRAPINIPLSTEDDSGRLLRQAIVAEGGETNLTMVDKILDAINWRMRILGDGTIDLSPYPENPTVAKILFDSRENDVIKPGISVQHDWFECPNVLRAVMDEQYAIAKDLDSDPILSIEARGREVWYEETDCLLNQGETLQEYANRRLLELQRVGTTIRYDRRFYPDILPTDLVRLNYPAQQISGLFMISTQSISFTHGAETSEEVVKI